MERTLYVCKEVDLFRIPPRTGRGHISGEWRVDDKIFTARLRVVSVGDVLEVRLEDPSNGEIFGVCPVPREKHGAAVEGAVDSSRNFALRIEDPVTKRHAFLGMNFAERSNAFDFNVALTDFEKQQKREEHIKMAAATSAASGGTSSAFNNPEAESLYRKQDLRLKEGQNISVSVKKKEGADNHSAFLARLGGSSTGAEGRKLPLPPPPPESTAVATSAFGASSFPQQQQQPSVEAPCVPHSSSVVQPSTEHPPKASAATVVASTEEGWATF